MAGTLVKQIAVGGLDSNFSYLCVAPDGSAFIVDPCGDAALIRKAVESVGPSLEPLYILLTHGHNDHWESLDEVRRFFPGELVGHPLCKAPCERRPDDGEKLPFGPLSLECLHTPGHSVDSVCYLLSDGAALFSGDTLFIDCCGYCEPSAMFKSMARLRALPDQAAVYSGHDYGHVPFETLGAQKLSNPYLKEQAFGDFKRALRDL